ncbi:LppM family (lipo)protein [Phytoactinopolyspora halotolerans]|uniref:LppM domain-containing protein n=1 Tax=Phytoactinopolyspora halotolerans TaxID=1981512 RepID=A0A6L9S2J3_9ACTN|nr:hypothetical protein [Phytoactinopolyspora halotolerans]NED98647.1 hypothetical protein [Phytoactinopolyspora halotolerans]
MKTTRVLRALGAAGLAVALTSCMKIDLDMEINADDGEDTVSGTIVMAFSQDFLDMAGMMGEDPDEIFEGFDDFMAGPEGDEIPEYAEVEEYDDGEYRGQQISYDQAPLDDFNSPEFSIVREGEEFVVSGNMDMTDDTGELEDVPPGMMENVDFDIRIAITFPGEVLEHNGELDGTTVTWRPQIGDNTQFEARAKDSGGAGGGFPTWLWFVIGGVVLAGLIGLLFALSRKGSGGEPATAAAPGQFPPPAGADAPPPPGGYPQAAPYGGQPGQPPAGQPPAGQPPAAQPGTPPASQPPSGEQPGSQQPPAASPSTPPAAPPSPPAAPQPTESGEPQQPPESPDDQR